MTTTVAPPAAAPTSPPISREPGVRFAIAHVVLVVATLLAAALHLDVLAELAVLAAAVAIGGHGLRPAWTTALGLSGWALLTGFLEHTAGTLSFAGGDLRHLALLVAIGLATGLATGLAAGR
ncbi:hypothetical protein D9V37_17725 [Nocardioides mangrovicus]|uniref:Histidine kinase n=1 Tax=Nocardioides mangrovicus TaxID=2478913 RepID=A0A3L8NXM8_9ACTN|nr:hypothetical protein [Nocardioides mangrovicus]RLV47945.1 hypothetical protein D9V37_17725 [Nocardioides mangrovicus]